MRACLFSIVVGVAGVVGAPACSHPAPAPIWSPPTIRCAQHVASLPPPPATELFEAGRWQDTVAAIDVFGKTHTGAAFARAEFREAWAHWMLGDTILASREVKASLDEVSSIYLYPGRWRGVDTGETEQCAVALFASERTIKPAAVATWVESIAGNAWTAYMMLGLAHLYDAAGRGDDALFAAYTAYARSY